MYVLWLDRVYYPVMLIALAALTKPNAPAGGSTAPIVAVPPPSMLRGKTIEEIVNRWSAELETHVREFNRFAGEVAVWDRALIENGHNVSPNNIHFLLLVYLNPSLAVVCCAV
jgi:nuclear pore complex protein Nup62